MYRVLFAWTQALLVILTTALATAEMSFVLVVVLRKYFLLLIAGVFPHGVCLCGVGGLEMTLASWLSYGHFNAFSSSFDFKYEHFLKV